MTDQNIFNHFPGIVYRGRQESNLKFDFASHGVKSLTGYTSAEWVADGFNFSELVHPLDREMLAKKTLHAINEKRSLSVQYRIISKQGEIHYIWDRRYFDFNNESEIAFEGFIIDVSEQKLAEKALLQAQGFAKAVLDTAVEAIITINTKGIIESFNQSAQDMFKYRSWEVIGQNVKILMPEPFKKNHDSFINNYVRTGEAQIIGAGREVIGLCKDGKQFPIYLSVSEVHHQTERKFVGLIRDLTEQRAAEIEAGTAREQLAHIDRVNMLNEMATGIAHEINQPLTAISMYAQTAIRLLQTSSPDLQRLEDALSKLSAQAQRAGSVIERMQSMVRHRDSHREIISCNTLVKGVLNLAELEAKMRNIDIDFDLVSQDFFVFCDPVQIQQVALNLLRNGMQAMESINCENGNRIKVKIEEDKNSIKFSVIDQGAGITPKIEKILFEPFSSSKKNSLGVGLSLCASIISSHGGQMGYTNNINGGANFYYTLPKVDNDSSGLLESG